MLKKYIIKPLILFLLFSQFATVAHAIEHQLEHEDVEQCLICLHETESKNLIANTVNAPSFDHGIYAKIIFSKRLYDQTKHALHSIRSPPTFLA